LHILLERAVAGAAPPASPEHVLVATEVAPLEAAAWRDEHGLEVVAASAREFLESLIAACDEAGLSLAAARPAADHLEGWVARLGAADGDVEADIALGAMVARARQAGQTERVIEIQLARVELAAPGPSRAAALVALARAFAEDAADAARALTALVEAMVQDP